MAFVITEPCISTCDTACVAVCPVDCCIPDENNVETEEILLKKQKFLHK